MSDNVTWGDLYEGIGLGSHDRINMSLEVLQENIGKRCRVVETCLINVKDKEGFIIDVAGSHNRYRYTVELDHAIQTSKHSSMFRKIYIPVSNVEILPAVIKECPPCTTFTALGLPQPKGNTTTTGSLLPGVKVGDRVKRDQPGDYTHGRTGEVLEISGDRLRVRWDQYADGSAMTPVRTWVNIKRLFKIYP